MYEKLSYWKYFKATRHSKLSDKAFYVYDKNKGIITAYKMPDKRKRWLLSIIYLIIVLIPIIIELILLDSAFSSIAVWRFLQADVFFGSILIFVLISFAVLQRVFSKWYFEKLSEVEWSKDKEKEFKKTQQTSRIFWILYVLILFGYLIIPDLFCLTYLRNIAEGGEGKVGSAQISIHVNNDIINLDEKTAPGELFIIKESDGSKYADIDIYTVRIPSEIRLLINGEEIDIMKQENLHVYIRNRIWDEDYFKTHVSFDMKYGMLNESNSIEIRAGGFDKVWTFTLYYE